MKFFNYLVIILHLVCFEILAQSVSFQTYMNPVIPGDHPDPTLTKIGNDFYTSGSSFNPTPKIYHSTDLVHWEVIAQPVSASWSVYGDSPGGGIWGGHMVYYNNKYWHFFGRGGGSMYFVTADQPEGPWSNPTVVRVPSGISSLGVDNSIFIDDDNRWYMLAKHGQAGNHIVELDDQGQPNGNVLDLTWLNPAPDYPYSWAEGPVMWKHNGYYYYSFAQHLVGSQYVMRSDTLTDDESAWTIRGTNIFTGTGNAYSTPNHVSPAVLLDDGTSWVVGHSYNSSWYAQGRQGLMCQVIYDEFDFPKILRPSDNAAIAPFLPSSGIPWMVPHSDDFNSEKLHPEWSFLGYTPETTWSLSERPGWLKLALSGRTGQNTVIKNDGEHNYSLITRVDFSPESTTQEAGLWIFNGPETLEAKVFSTLSDTGSFLLAFSFDNTRYEVENTIGQVVWLKLTRDEHKMSGYYSEDGFNWIKIGEEINVQPMNLEVTQFNNFTGNQQGLYIKNKEAFFDLYIYRDAYSPIWLAYPANQYGTSFLYNLHPPHSLRNIHSYDWALYAGVEFGNDDYVKSPDSLRIVASCNSSGGTVAVYVDSIDADRKIADCYISNTGSSSDYSTFTVPVLQSVTGNHDVYLQFTGMDSGELFRLKTLEFVTNSAPSSNELYGKNELPEDFMLMQNYPNPFNPSTVIRYSIPHKGHYNLSVYNVLGQKVAELFSSELSAGYYNKVFNAEQISSGIYIYTLSGEGISISKKMILLR